MATPPKYLFLYLRTGGGHLAPARSIARYLSEHHRGACEPVLVDGLTEAAAFARYIIEDGYRLLQAKAKWYYEFLYATNKFPPIGYFNVFAANFFIKPYIRKRLAEERPEKIVIFHFFLIAPVYQVLRELGWSIPVITAVTDPYTAHPLWFQRKEQRYILFSERLKQERMRKGIPEDRLQVFPFIVDDRFTSALTPDRSATFRAAHSFDPNRKTVLIIGGGDGIPHGAAILKKLLTGSVPANIVIVCGKNKELFNAASALQKEYPQLTVFGFVDFVFELLNIADVVITKCGASTIMEILMMKKVPVIIDYLWEQELGNMEFVRDAGMGIFERDIAKLPAIVRRLCVDPEWYGTFVRNIESQRLRNGTRPVAEYLLKVSV